MVGLLSVQTQTRASAGLGLPVPGHTGPTLGGRAWLGSPQLLPQPCLSFLGSPRFGLHLYLCSP